MILVWVLVLLLLLALAWMIATVATDHPVRRIRRRMLSTFVLEHLRAVARLRLPLTGSLTACASRLPEVSGRVLEDIEDNLQDGLLVGDALVQAPRYGGSKIEHLEDLLETFRLRPRARLISPAEAEVLRIGEMSGDLAHVLDVVVRERRRIDVLRSWLHANLVYPMAILLVLASVLSGILVYILPKFNEMFIELDVALPSLTRWIVLFGRNAEYHWYWGVMFLIPITFVVRYRRRLLRSHSRGPQRMADLFRRLAYWIPFAHGPMYRALLGEFCRELAMLLRVETPAARALSVIAEGTMNPWFRGQVARAAALCERGEDLATALDTAHLGRRAGWFAQATSSSGDLADALESVAEDQSEHVSWLWSMAGSVIPPFVILFLGIGIGLAVIGLFLPLVTLMNSMGG